MTKVSTRLILKKSRDLKIPYRNLLQGVAREQVVERLFALPENYKVALMKTGEYGIDSYRTSNTKDVYVRVKEKGVDGMYLTAMIAMLVEDGEEKAVIEEFEDGAKVRLSIPFDKVTIPVNLYLFPLKDEKNDLEDITFRLSYENDRVLNITALYPEKEIANYFAILYDKQEFLSDMSILYNLYSYGTKRTFSGRKLMVSINDELVNRGLILTEERYHNMKSALASKSSKTKYRAFLSLGKRKEPIYEEIIKVIDEVFDPVIDTLLKDEIFFGEYMPELKRYL
ncbi:MAG: hypothetical protein K6E39_03815 [Lachnospiraceae bacterium]|nr:hypothetical protein [Lachnospiraceae bacterium]